MDQLDNIINALSYIPADDRECWLKLGMAIKSELGETGFHIWNEWGQTGASYNQKDTHATWRSIDASGGVNIGTLFHIAKEYGYEPKRRLKSSHALDYTTTSIKQELEVERAIKADAAAKQANVIWHNAQNGLEHTYIKLKCIESLGARFQYAEHRDCQQVFWTKDADGNLIPLTGLLLLLPLYNIDGKLRGLQAIDEKGLKSLQKGIAKSGLFMPLFNGQKIPSNYAGDLLFTEGFATANAVRYATEQPTIMAIDAGNLHHVAKAWRIRCPNANIIIVGR